jgi:hypothetical protein
LPNLENCAYHNAPDVNLISPYEKLKCECTIIPTFIMPSAVWLNVVAPSTCKWRHDTKHNDTQHNDIEHNNIHHDKNKLLHSA